MEEIKTWWEQLICKHSYYYTETKDFYRKSFLRCNKCGKIKSN